MRITILIVSLATLATCKPLAKSYASDYGYNLNPASGLTAFATSSQYHAQDEAGQYNYGYANPLSTKQESKSADGVVRGSYSYIDANGKLQRVDYVSDVFGFRAAGTNIPSAPVGYAQGVVRAVPVSQVVEAQTSPAATPSVLAPTVAYTYLPYATNYGYFFNPAGYGERQFTASIPVAAEEQALVKQAEPVPVQQVVQPVPVQQVVQPVPVQAYAEPVPVQAYAEPAPVQASSEPVQVVQTGAPYVTQTKYHAQDEFGQYTFGYSDPNSARTETKTADGVVRGSYNYVDDQGKIQTVHYIADSLGFRVVGSNIPVDTYTLPVQVEETPEVVAARLEHERLFADILARDQELQDIEEISSVPNEQPVPVQKTFEPVVAEIGPVLFPANIPEVPLAPVAPVAPVAPATSSQFHAQDEQGQYTYGYNTPESAKVEQKTADGTVTGSYKYVDADGHIQAVNYISDALGFRVAATNLPEHIVEQPVAAEPAPVQVVDPRPAHVVTPQVAYSYLPYATKYQYLLPPGSFQSQPINNQVPVVNQAPVVNNQAPVVNNQAPVVKTEYVSTAPVVTSSQFHAQDEAGQYNYGYANPLSTKQESKTADGVVRGSYSYVDANGQLQRVDYISDALGFRAAGTNFPDDGKDEAMIEANVAYSYLPYAVNHQYYF